MKQEEPITQKVGSYRLGDPIGKGGFATVYSAEHEELHRLAAVKVLDLTQLDEPNERERINREVEKVCRLTHPGIVKVLGLDRKPERVSIVMEYLSGGDLYKWQKDHTQIRGRNRMVPREEFLRIIGEVAAALDYAHGCEVVHRDVKPSNILLDADGRAKLIDFGLARAKDEPRLTPNNKVPGTAIYISPEQARGDKEINGRSDQYSLAVVAYELLVGRPPFEGETASKISMMHVNDDPPLPSSRNPNLPFELDQVLFKALAKLPANRYPDCPACACALEEAFQAADERLFPVCMGKARDQLEAMKYNECSRSLDEAGEWVPRGHGHDTEQEELEEMRGRLKAYQEMASKWETANTKAKAVLKLRPKFRDRKGVFAALGLRKLSLAHLSPRERALQAVLGLLLAALATAAALLATALFVLRFMK